MTGLGYNYTTRLKIEEANNALQAIEFTIKNYFYFQLGWTIEDCQNRFVVEAEREIPKGIFNYLEKIGWNLNGKKIIDVGSGQGGAVLEALSRGADAYGIEPGDEFAKLSKMRLKEAFFDDSKIMQVSGDKLPFENDSFDYAISLQVMEHVKNPIKIIEEIYRVLKPGGQCYISCENYLSFREQHYRIAWFPLLPKPLGSLYLKMKGRNPYFLNNYVFYTTYPQIWRLTKRAGFNNITYKYSVNELLYNKKTRSKFKNLSISLLKLLPMNLEEKIILFTYHIRNFYRVGVRVLLEKPFY